MEITKVRLQERIVELSQPKSGNGANVFTVVIGPNGSGKSTLFRYVCTLLLRITNQIDEHDDLIDRTGRFSTPPPVPGSIAFSSGMQITEYVLSTSRLSAEDRPDLSTVPSHMRQQAEKSWQYALSKTWTEVSARGSHDSESTGLLPRKLIAVSSSPFDKFPIIDRKRLRTISGDGATFSYHYRGARAVNEFGKGYLASKIDQLGASFAEFFLRPEERIRQLEPLFLFLGLGDSFKVSLGFPFFFNANDLLDKNGRGAQRVVDSLQFHRAHGEKLQLNDSETEKIKDAVQYIFELIDEDGQRYPHPSFNFELSLRRTFEDSDLLRHVAFLARYGIVELHDIEFRKRAHGTTYRLSEASSGELCILFNALAIASLIEDDSVVLIDEPELSLHPDWQLRFIPLISELFKEYRGCHFIVATHSSQIVASIPEKASFVVNMEKNAPTALDGAIFSGRSSDFLLSEAFNAPGWHNEYLIGQAVDLLSELSEEGALGAGSRSRAEDLIRAKSALSDLDPACRLISTLETAIEGAENAKNTARKRV